MQIFQSQGHPQSSGDVYFFHFAFSPRPLSPLSMSSITPSAFKERSNVVKAEDKGGLSRAGMFVSITHRCQQGDRLEKYFLACQRRDPLTGGLRHRKFSVILSTAYCLSFPSVTSL